MENGIFLKTGGTLEKVIAFKLKASEKKNPFGIPRDAGIVGIQQGANGSWKIYFDDGGAHPSSFEDRARNAAIAAFQGHITKNTCLISEADAEEHLEAVCQMGPDCWIDRPGIRVEFCGETSRDTAFKKWLYPRVAENMPKIVVQYSDSITEEVPGATPTLLRIEGRPCVSWFSKDSSQILIKLTPPLSPRHMAGRFSKGT